VIVDGGKGLGLEFKSKGQMLNSPLSCELFKDQDQLLDWLVDGSLPYIWEHWKLWDIGELEMNHIESDPHGSPVAPTNEHQRNLGEVYLPVLSSVLSMEVVDENL
jgi:hypothetical protein